MKKLLFIVPLVAATLTSCASCPKHGCVALEFSHIPSIATQTALAKTTSSNPQDVYTWFATGHLDFFINCSDKVANSNAIAAALKDGGTICY